MALPQGYKYFGAVPCTVLRVGNLIRILRVISSLHFCTYLAEILRVHFAIQRQQDF